MFKRITQRLYGLDNGPVFSSIRRGFLLTIPVVLTGCIPLLILNFPIPAFRPWLEMFAGGFFFNLLLFIYDSTVGLMSAYITLAISYYYAEQLAPENANLQVLAMINALACFAASFGGASGSLTLSSFGTTGVFTAMICSILGTRLFFLLEKRAFRRFSSNAMGADLNYRASTTAIFPMLATVAAFVLLNQFMVLALHVNNFNDLIANWLTAMFSGIESELGNGVLFVFMINLLWFFGIHGGNALDPVAQTLYVTADTEITQIVSKSFLDNFALMGGCGATICLVVALLIMSRARGDRQLARSALPLAVFNINEPLVYGLPVILNPVMFIPFILVPLVSLFIGYLAIITGFMPMVAQDVRWTTPPFVSGYQATGSIRGSIVQLIIIAVGAGIYAPFVVLLERVRSQQAAGMLSELTRGYIEDQKLGITTPYMSRRGQLGNTAKSMVSQLKLDIENHNIAMHYQPQFDENEQIVGAEALLRWTYSGQRVYPPLTVALAQEGNCYQDLTWAIISVVLNDAKKLLAEIDPALQLSINITAEQLNDPAFVRKVLETIKGKNIALDLVLEVTEESSLDNYSNIASHIDLFNENGIMMAIDDFSMGQTSLNFLHSNRFQYVKLDGSLVKQVVENLRARDIIASIVSLGKTLDFEVVAEYVENEEIRQVLLGLGVETFQGYLYSPALPADEFIDFAKKHTVAAEAKSQRIGQ